MRAIRSRITRIERKRQHEASEDKTQHYKLMQLINRCPVREMPGLEWVRPEHTDLETCRDIQEKLAWARGEFAEAERLRDLDPGKHVPPKPGTPGEERLRAARNVLERSADRAPKRIERARAAVVRAVPS